VLGFAVREAWAGLVATAQARVAAALRRWTRRRRKHAKAKREQIPPQFA